MDEQEKAAKKREQQRRWREKNPTYFRDKKREAYAKNREKILAQNKAWRDRNKDGMHAYEAKRAPVKRDYNKEWRQRNPEKVRAAMRSWVSRNRPKVARLMRDWGLRTKYGLTREAYEAMIAAQAGKCDICKREPEKGLVVDHDHNTGKVRALLCHSCNRALGLLGDDVERARVAVAYLERYSQA